MQAPLRDFLATETGSATVLLAAAVAALAWANIDLSSYERVWHTQLSIQVGGLGGISQDLRYWVNSGLMTLFFFVAGLEVRREFDMGELRDRRRLALPLASRLRRDPRPHRGFSCLERRACLGARLGDHDVHRYRICARNACPGGARRPRAAPDIHADRVDRRRCRGPDRDRDGVFGRREGLATAGAAALFALIVLAVNKGVNRGLFYSALGVAAWLALSASGLDPIIIGLAMGLLTPAAPVARGDLERASDLFRRFREQPTPELARTASVGLESAISPNDRLQRQYHPWTSYLVVPVFALANAGIVVRAGFLGHALTSPVTVGILVGSVVGKPIGVAGATWLTARFSAGAVRPPVGWWALVGGGTIAGIGFTVSLLIATLAFRGEQLEEAKLGILIAAVAASALTWLVFRATRCCRASAGHWLCSVPSSRSSTSRYRSTPKGTTSVDQLRAS